MLPPLDHLAAKAGGAAGGGAYAPFILTARWLGWLCYFMGYQLSAWFCDTRFFGNVFIRMRA